MYEIGTGATVDEVMQPEWDVALEVQRRRPLDGAPCVDDAVSVLTSDGEDVFRLLPGEALLLGAALTRAARHATVGRRRAVNLIDRKRIQVSTSSWVNVSRSAASSTGASTVPIVDQSLFREAGGVVEPHRCASTRILTPQLAQRRTSEVSSCRCLLAKRCGGGVVISRVAQEGRAVDQRH